MKHFGLQLVFSLKNLLSVLGIWWMYNKSAFPVITVSWMIFPYFLKINLSIFCLDWYQTGNSVVFCLNFSLFEYVPPENFEFIYQQDELVFCIPISMVWNKYIFSTNYYYSIVFFSLHRHGILNYNKLLSTSTTVNIAYNIYSSKHWVTGRMDHKKGPVYFRCARCSIL